MLSNYTIKQALPRLILAAIAINLSYWICAVFVDISNLLGQSIFAILKQLHGTVLQPPDIIAIMEMVLAGAVTTSVVGGTVAVGLTAALAIAGPQFLIGLILMFFSIFLGIALAIFVALLILAARQALIVILIFVSPIAFALYVLPGTKSWFDRWRKLLTTMLVFYPLFAILYGGSLVAAGILIGLSGDPATAEPLKGILLMMGIVAQFAGLIMTPWLLKGSSGFIGKAAGRFQQKASGLAEAPGKYGKKRVRDGMEETGRGLRAGFKRTALSFDPGSRRGRALRTLAFSGERREARKHRAEESIKRSGSQYGLEDDRMRQLHESSMIDSESASGLKAEADAHAIEHSADARQAIGYNKYQSTEASLRKSVEERAGETQHVADNQGLYATSARSQGDLDIAKSGNNQVMEELKTEQGFRIHTGRNVDGTVATDAAGNAMTPRSPGVDIATAQRIHASEALRQSTDKATSSAKRQQVTQEAERILNVAGAAEAAGGIDPYGADRAKAVAQDTVVAQFREVVGQEKNTMSQIKHDKPDPTKPIDPDTNPAGGLMELVKNRSLSKERRAAAAGKIGGNKYRDGHLELIEYLSDPANASDADLVDIQQQAFADMSSNKPTILGDTQTADLQNGDLRITPRTIADPRTGSTVPMRIREEMMMQRLEQKKFSEKSLASLDPDEVKVLETLRRKGIFDPSSPNYNAVGASHFTSTIKRLREPGNTFYGTAKEAQREVFDAITPP